METTFPSQRFGEYRILSKVGEGGMAEVFRAEVVDDVGDIRTVILKLLKPDISQEFVEVFDFEADLMGLLDHPHLVSRLEVGQSRGQRFLAMEDVFGGDLAQLMFAYSQSEESFPLPLALAIIVKLLCGLAYFHQATSKLGEPLGLVHSDVNPANVFLSVSGDVKLGDFGVSSATNLRAAHSGLVDGITIGKLHYLSPEQTAGEAASSRSDLFSVGVMLFELVVGWRPFEGETEQDTLNRIYQAKVDIPSALVDSELSRIIRRALAARAKDRYPTAGDLCGDLVRYQLNRNQQCGAQTIRDEVATMLGVIS